MERHVKRVQIVNPYLIQSVMWSTLSPAERALPNYKYTLNRTYQPADRRLFEIDPQSYLATFAVTHLGSLRIAAMTDRRGTVCITKAPGMNAVCLSLPKQGRVELRSPDSQEIAVADQSTGIIYSGRAGNRGTTSDNTKSLSVWIPAAKLKTCMEALVGQAISDDLVFRSTIDLTSGAGASIRQLTGHIEQELARPDSLTSSHIGIDLLEDLLCRYILQGLPHSHSGLLARPARMTDLRSVRRAEDYLRAHLTEPLTLSDLARAVGCSSRSLQLAFRNARDTTPMAALQQARLERAREVLMREGANTSVVDVALRFGFSNPGRFAKLYRKAFREKPLDTLRRGG
jgi:AraC-like DNA-binding protein